MMLFISQAFAAYEKLDGVAAIVDTGVITESQLKNKMEVVRTNFRSSGEKVPPEEVIREEVLNKLILESLQLQMATKAGVDISEDRLSEAMLNIAQNNNVSLNEFKARLEAEGITYNEMRDQVKRDMLIQQVQQGFLRNRIQISEKEIENFLQSADGKNITTTRFNISHILLPLSERATQQDEDKAKAFLIKTREELLNGERNFKALVSGANIGGYAVKGTSFGWKTVDEIPSLFADHVKGMKAGEISNPVRSGAGLHLIKLSKMRGGTKLVHQINARHILIKTSEVRDIDQAKAYIADILKRINEGEDFALLAKEYSEDSGSALQGGELGWSNPGKFVPEFTAALKALKDDEISQPIKTDFGWHIIQKIGERDHDMTSEQQRNQAYRAIYEKKFQDELDAWLVQIKDEAFIEIK